MGFTALGLNDAFGENTERQEEGWHGSAVAGKPDPLRGYGTIRIDPETVVEPVLRTIAPIEAAAIRTEELLPEDDARAVQLRALDRAVEAGVLTGEEGAARRSVVLRMPARSVAAEQEGRRRKRAAIESALAAEILTPEEAGAKLAALEGGGSAAEIAETVAPAPHPRKVEGPAEVGDARGRFRLRIPEGWTVEDEAGGLRLVFGDAWAIFETSSEPGKPVDVAQRHAEKMRPFYGDWRVVNGGPFTTKRGREAGGWTITASWQAEDGERRRAILLVWSVGAGEDRFVTMTSSADSAGAKAANVALMAIFDSVRFAGDE